MKKHLIVFALMIIVVCVFLSGNIFAEDTVCETRTVSGQWTYTVSNGAATLTAYSGTATSVSIPNYIDGYKVTGLGNGLFQGNESITKVSFPDTLQSIGSSAFRNCTALTSITLPVNLTSIGTDAFINCTALSSITVNSEELSLNYYVTGSGNTFLNAGKKAPNGITLTFGDKVTKIPAYMFGYGENDYARIKTVKMGSAIKTIGNNAFQNCSDLTSVFLPVKTENIASNAFSGCKKLVKIFLLNRNCSISNNQSTLGVCGTTVVYGFANSAAQTYAQKYGYTFVPLTRFSDVKESAYYFNAVTWAVANGITSGTGNGKFNPKGTCTREQIVTFLYAACGKPGHHMTSNPFSDVKSGKYYYNAVMWAVENGITGGVGGGKFGVGQGCTREQAVTFLWKAVGCPKPSMTTCPFTDVKSNKYYYKAVLWAFENGIASGVSSNKFGVGKTCTRAQIVTFLFNTFR